MRTAFNWSLELEFIACYIGKLKGNFRAFFVVFSSFLGVFCVVEVSYIYSEYPYIYGFLESGLWLHLSEFKIYAR